MSKHSTPGQCRSRVKSASDSSSQTVVFGCMAALMALVIHKMKKVLPEAAFDCRSTLYLRETYLSD